jgi:5-methylcytosine-specific restriction endonuclease McrA
MKKRGPVTKKWIETRDKWLEQNKAEYYICHYCPTRMTRSQLTLDHYKSRGRHPELRFSLKNLVPCCAPCNTAKGSLSGDEYIQRLKEAGKWQETA